MSSVKTSSIESIPLPPAAPQIRRPVKEAKGSKPGSALVPQSQSSVTLSQKLVRPQPKTMDCTALDDIHLHEMNVANLNQLARMRDQTEKFAYRRVLPALNETILRYKQPGRSTRLNGIPKIEDYLQSIGLHYATVRKWNERERKATLALLPAPPKKEPTKRLISKADEAKICATVTIFKNLKEAVSTGEFERAANIANGGADFALRNYVGHLAGRTAFSRDSPVPPAPAPPSVAQANETKLSIANRIVDTILASDAFDDVGDLRTLALAYRTAVLDTEIINITGRYEQAPLLEPISQDQARAREDACQSDGGAVGEKPNNLQKGPNCSKVVYEPIPYGPKVLEVAITGQAPSDPPKLKYYLCDGDQNYPHPTLAGAKSACNKILERQAQKQHKEGDSAPPQDVTKRFRLAEHTMGDLKELVIMDGHKVHDCYSPDDK